MRALGRQYDAAVVAPPTNAATAGITGRRVNVKGCSQVTFLVNAAAAASGTDALTLTLNQHTASTGGTTTAAAVISDYHWKVAASTNMDGSETWARVTQATASTVVIAGANATKEALVAVEVNVTSLAAGNQWVSLNVSQPSVARTVAIEAVTADLVVQRKPVNLPSQLGA